MDVKKRGPVATLAQGKTGPAGDSMAEEQQALKKKKNSCDGLVGLVNIGNSCYMNATVQALSNCPPFRQYFIDCHQQGQAYSTPQAADNLSALFKKMWTSERHPGHLSPRTISSGMKNKMFRGSQQQDAQEFLRCLLTQIHDEIKVPVPDSLVCGCGQVSCDQNCLRPRDSMVSCTSHDSNTSTELLHQKVTNSAKNSPLLKKRTKHHSQKGSSFTTHTTHSSPAIQPKFSFSKGKSKLLGASAGSKTSVESIPQLVSHHGGSKLSLVPTTSETIEEGVRWSKDDLFVVDLIMRTVTVHQQYFAQAATKEEGSITSKASELAVPSSSRSRSLTPTLPHHHHQQPQRHKQLGSKDSSSSISSSDSAQGSLRGRDGRGRGTDNQTGGEGGVETTEGCRKEEERVSDSAGSIEEVDGRGSSKSEDCHGRSPVAGVSGRGSVPPSPVPSHQSTSSCGGVPLRERRKRVGPPCTTSIVNEVFEGVLESRVKCLACKKVSVTREPFQDLSLPIPGRKEIAKINSKVEHGGEEKGGGEESGRSRSSLSRGLSTVWNFMTALTRDYVTGPPTNINDCLNTFFDASELKGENKYYCSNCKSFQNSLKEMSIVRLPEVLCIHFKRFRFDTYLSTKISRHITFPLTDLDLSPYIKEMDNPHTCNSGYDLNAVVTHYGGAGGGHYVAFAKNSLRNSWFEYNDTRIHPVSADTVLSAEGYVLFYKKAAPNQSSQPLDLNTFLPRAGTRLPSPDICYISRHWLYLLKHFSSPGPILQYEYACKHGAVVPEKAAGASSLAMCIRREVWEELEQKHGGGPLVPRLEACTVCQDLLESLKARRMTEKERVHQLQTQERQVEKDRKSEPYLLSIEWLQQWQKFIHCTTLEVEPPGPVDNTQLLQVSAGDKVTLVDGALFRKLSPAAWKYFLHIYGGGPTIVTTLDALQ